MLLMHVLYRHIIGDMSVVEINMISRLLYLHRLGVESALGVYLCSYRNPFTYYFPLVAS